MPPKTRDFYTTEYTGRDFFWFTGVPGSGSSATRNPRHRTGPKSRSSSKTRSITHKPPSVRKPPSMFGVSKRPRRAKMASIVEESPDLYMAPAIVTTPPSEPRNPESEPDSKKPPGPWSEWYETRDQSRFWRARKLPDDSWTYEYSPTKPASTIQPKPTKPTPGSNRSLASFFFGIPLNPSPAQTRPPSIFPPPPRDNLNPPDEATSTITTSDSDSSTPSLNNPHLNIPQPRSSGTTFPSFVSTGKGKGSSLSILSSSERISTLSRHEVDSSTPRKGKGSKGHTSQKANPKGKPSLPAAAAAAAGNGVGNVKENAKKLHNRVKNEKELRIDTKKRVKGWLKDVVPEVAQSEWDDQGLPVYK
ncbi:hypothetical protein QBC34DRAFT_422270 [Podospora aff. communis PSN243]|uniref:Uncharacterized protein n=1 Tax=Podospora aff. communis PSN243 TaxID=3040156 RepID=A0AAV9GXH5_9PEZI|nr:hypothetical protein QBC34DRAFT_422270 [Podospora aff. communis PSN243]